MTDRETYLVAIEKEAREDGIREGARQIVALLTEKLLGGDYGSGAGGVVGAVYTIRKRYLSDENPWPENTPAWHEREREIDRP